ncbi:MAG: FecR domain-containing protein [Pseudomonadota bacterium]
MKLKTILLLAGSLLAMALSAGAEEGRAIAVLGDVTLQRGDQSLKLKRGTPIQVGDRIRTGDGAAAQLRMSDESILAVRQKSEVEITSYRFAADKPEEGAARFSLIKGGLRTLTGKIGVHARPNYEVNAVVATIGIRGTHFRLQLCDKDCESEGAQAKDGLYGGVTEGRIAVTNEVGETEFGVDEYFFLADAQTMPERLPSPPDLLNDRLAALAAARKSGATAAAASAQETAPTAFLPETAGRPSLITDTFNALSVTQIRPIEERIAPDSLATVHPIIVPPTDNFVAVGGAGDIRGQIVWLTNADIDLHLLTPAGTHLYYGNPQVALTSGANAQLDHDNLGSVIDIAPDKRVENIVVTGSAIPIGDYSFYAHSFSGNNNGLPTSVQIRVTGDGNQTSQTDTATLSSGQNSSNYIVDYQGPGLAPQYRVQP